MRIRKQREATVCCLIGCLLVPTQMKCRKDKENKSHQGLSDASRCVFSSQEFDETLSMSIRQELVQTK